MASSEARWDQVLNHGATPTPDEARLLRGLFGDDFQQQIDDCIAKGIIDVLDSSPVPADRQLVELTSTPCLTKRPA